MAFLIFWIRMSLDHPKPIYYIFQIIYHRYKNNFYVFIIPDSRKHGAQNFFRRLHENFDSKNKMLVIEEKSSFIQNFFLRI